MSGSSTSYVLNGLTQARDAVAGVGRAATDFAVNPTAEGAGWLIGKASSAAGYMNKSKLMDGSLVPNKDVGDGSTYGAMRNVVKDYRWTLSKTQNRNDIPYIRLIEYRANETVLQKQLNIYSQLVPSRIGNTFGATQDKKPALKPYEELFPKTDPTGFSYWFPYFSKTSLELSTPNWTQVEPAGKAIMDSTKTLGETWLSKEAAGKIDIASSILDGAATAANIAAAANYPIVGAMDRPRIFASHSERTITISFPLFNTVEEGDWVKNRELIYLLMEQNLYNKRDYATGLPPVFYDVYIPGQYYCFASCVTNINVENLGNTRLLLNEFIVPDAYQVTITLSEMTMPSKNQFAAIFNGEAQNQVKTTTATNTSVATPLSEGPTRRAAEQRNNEQRQAQAAYNERPQTYTSLGG